MKNIFRFLTYAFVGLMIVIGIALIVWRDQIIAYFAGPEIPTNETVAPSGAASALDLGPLSEPRFLSLKNNVINFDFDNICHRPSAFVSPVSAPVTVAGAEETATTTASALPTACVIGNSLPLRGK